MSATKVAAGGQEVHTIEESQRLYLQTKEHAWFYPALMIVLALLDLGLLAIYYFYVYLEQRVRVPILLALHVVLFMIVVILRRTSSPQTREISPLMYLLLPGVGSLFYGLSYITLYLIGMKFKRKGIRHSYSEENVEYKKSVSVDFEQVGRIMDMAGVFSYSNSLSKKEMIVDLLSGDLSVNSQLLKKGLGDKDPEVVHYTASTLNYLEERYEKAIQEARDACVTELTQERLSHVAVLYDRYMRSGLLDSDILPIYRKSYIQVLELMIKEFGYDPETVSRLFDAYLDAGDIELARALMEKGVNLFP